MVVSYYIKINNNGGTKVKRLFRGSSKLLLLTFLVSLVAACKKDQEYFGVPDEEQNPSYSATPAPVADPGPDRKVILGTGVLTLDGSGSYHPSPSERIYYEWTWVARPEGSSAELKNITSEKARFTPDKVGTYRVQLMVYDRRTSHSAIVNIDPLLLPDKPPSEGEDAGEAPGAGA